MRQATVDCCVVGARFSAPQGGEGTLSPPQGDRDASGRERGPLQSPWERKRAPLIAANIRSTHMKWLLHVNNTHKKCIKMRINHKLTNKTLENCEKIVYACMRYPISVWHTVLVQNI